jgi:hypothetical protein
MRIRVDRSDTVNVNTSSIHLMKLVPQQGINEYTLYEDDDVTSYITTRQSFGNVRLQSKEPCHSWIW